MTTSCFTKVFNNCDCAAAARFSSFSFFAKNALRSLALACCLLFGQAAWATDYVFTGGSPFGPNWSSFMNWSNFLPPPSVLQAGDRVFVSSSCNMDVIQVSNGAKFFINAPFFIKNACKLTLNGGELHSANANSKVTVEGGGTLSSSATLNIQGQGASILGGGTWSNSGQLTVQGANGIVSTGNLFQSGGTINIHSFIQSNGGAMNFNGGANLNFNGIGFLLQTAGTFTVSGSVNFNFNGTGFFQQSGGTFNVNGNLLFVCLSQTSFAKIFGGTLNINGQLNFNVVSNPATGMFLQNATLNINNNGKLFTPEFNTFRVANLGVLNINNGGTWNIQTQGSSQILTNGTVNLKSGGTLNILGVGQLQITGKLNVLVGGVLNNANTLRLQNGGTIVIHSNPVALPGGNFIWESGGTVEIGATGVMTVSTPMTLDGGKILAVSGSLICNADISLSAASIRLKNGGTFTLNPGTTNGGILFSSLFIWDAGGKAVVGAGAAFTISTFGAVALPVGGLLDVFGTLGFTQAQVDVRGVLTVKTNGTLNVNTLATRVFNSGNLISQGTINLNSGELRLDQTGNFPSGTAFNWVVGTKVKIGSTGNITANQPISLMPGQTLEILSGGAFSLAAALTPLGTIMGAGTFKLVSGGHLHLSPAFPNLPGGNFQWLGGNLTLHSGANTTFATDRTMPASSQMTIENGASLTVNPGFTFTTSSTSTLTNQGIFKNNGTFNKLGTFNNQGTYTGDGTMFGFFQNPVGGIFAPGNNGAGCHSFSSASNQNLGKMLLQIGGTTGCSQHDRVLAGVEGTQTLLGGTLEIQFINNYSPTAGAMHTIILADEVVGTFSNVLLPTGFSANVVYTLNEVKISFAYSQTAVASDRADNDNDGQMEAEDLSNFEKLTNLNLLVFNELGQVLRNETIASLTENGLLSLPLGGLAAGTYFLKLRDENGEVGVARFVVAGN